MKRILRTKKARGVAILTVMVAIALMMAVVTEVSTRELVRYKLAVNERDALQAEALAQSGANFAQLILTVQEPLQTYLANFANMGIQLPAYTVWEMMPIDSDLLKGITDGSFFPDFGLDKNKAEKAEEPADKKKALVSENKAKDVPLFGEYKVPEGGYGAFAGRFSTEIEDEQKKIPIGNWPKFTPPKRKQIADQIFRILSKKEHEILFDGSTGNNKNIGPSQLIGYIYDYVSEEERAIDVTAPKESFGRDTIGDKRTPYVDTPDILPKRAPMDSLGELRLIPGVTDAIYQVLSKAVSIYSDTETVNVLSASDEVLGSVFYVCTKEKETSKFQQFGFETELLTEWNRRKNEGELKISAEGIISFLEENGIEVDKEECNKSIGTQSKTFTIKSTATVGTVTKTLVVRLRSASGITTLYQFQYL